MVLPCQQILLTGLLCLLCFHVSLLLVLQAEGLEKTFSTSLLFEVSPVQPSLSRYVRFSFPGDVVEGSERVSVTAVGMLTHTQLQAQTTEQSPCSACCWLCMYVTLKIKLHVETLSFLLQCFHVKTHPVQ